MKLRQLNTTRAILQKNMNKLFGQPNKNQPTVIITEGREKRGILILSLGASCYP